MSKEIRAFLIELRYARLKIEKIEHELKTGPSMVSSGELRSKVDLVMGALKNAKSWLKEK